MVVSTGGRNTNAGSDFRWPSTASDVPWQDKPPWRAVSAWDHLAVPLGYSFAWSGRSLKGRQWRTAHVRRPASSASKSRVATTVDAPHALRSCGMTPLTTNCACPSCTWCVVERSIDAQRRARAVAAANSWSRTTARDCRSAAPPGCESRRVSRRKVLTAAERCARG